MLEPTSGLAEPRPKNSLPDCFCLISFNSILLSYDEFSEKIYDIIGFKDKEQKKHLYYLKIEMYKKFHPNNKEYNFYSVLLFILYFKAVSIFNAVFLIENT